LLLGISSENVNIFVFCLTPAPADRQQWTIRWQIDASEYWGAWMQNFVLRVRYSEYGVTSRLPGIYLWETGIFHLNVWHIDGFMHVR
jgi:hypothetical protein